MQSFQFVLFIFRFEALVLLREVTRDVFLTWLFPDGVTRVFH